ncbi:MAG TPA: outer membrane protein assembly factor BamA [Tepidisphaeraceae bacterium]
MKATDLRQPALRLLLAASAALPCLAFAGRAAAQAAPAPAATAVSPTPQLVGRAVEDVRVLGNVQVATSVIRNVIRTKPGDKYDPATVQEDYQRVYDLKKFANVEAQVEPTETGGVIVVFVVREQKLIKQVVWRGNVKVDTPSLQGVVDLKPGQAIDLFRVSLAKQAITNVYRDKNFPFAHVDVPIDPLTQKGELIFQIVEGPQVRVRKINFVGAHAFSQGRLMDQIKTRTWFPIFNAGKYDEEQVEEDMGAIRRFYSDHGFFDVRVGRKLIFSPDQSELQIDFLIDEGARYVIDRVSFAGNSNLSDAQLRPLLKLQPGMYYDAETEQRDVNQVVKAYSPFGFIYAQPGSPGQGDPDYLHILPQQVFLKEPGRLELLFNIKEGKPFRVGRIIVRGNDKSQDKLVLREFRDFVPGQVYDSGKVQDALERVKALPFFQNVTMTPIGDDPQFRDLLVEVTEQRTASFNIGAGVNSNGGLGGNITYTQSNFDISNVPADWRDILSDHAFTGAGQGFRASFNPGTIFTTADLQFNEPWLFDQPYSFGNDLYLQEILREHYRDRRIGDRITFGKRFDYENQLGVTLRGEQVNIGSIDRPRFRPFEILAAEGNSYLTSVGLNYRRDTTNPGVLPFRGTVTTAGVEVFGALGGDYSFQRFTIGWAGYQTLKKDLLDRPTVLGVHLNAGFIPENGPFFERFYGGGIGSMRGFAYRGVSPRAGREFDPVGGNFEYNGTVEVNFPIYEQMLRGVVFSDFGDVESDVKLAAFRSSLGAGIRFTLPFLGQTPIAIDFAVPITKAGHDQQQVISFSFGLLP